MEDFLSFRKFITPVVIKVLYLLYSAGVVLSGLIVLIASTMNGGFGGFIVGLLVGALVTVIGLIGVRIGFELIYLLFGIYESLQEIRKSVAPGSLPQGFQVEPIAPVAPPPQV